MLLHLALLLLVLMLLLLLLLSRLTMLGEISVLDLAMSGLGLAHLLLLLLSLTGPAVAMLAGRRPSRSAEFTDHLVHSRSPVNRSDEH